MKLGLIEGRHPLPVDDYIFSNEIKDVKDFDYMETVIKSKLYNMDSVDIYVAGLTVVTVAVINYCISNNIQLTLYHFDRESGDYFPQKVNTVQRV